MAMFLLQTAFGSALGIALAPTAKDPKLVWMYSKSPVHHPPNNPKPR